MLIRRAGISDIPDILRLADPIASGRGLGETSCRSRLDRDKANLLYFG